MSNGVAKKGKQKNPLREYKDTPHRRGQLPLFFTMLNMVNIPMVK